MRMPSSSGKSTTQAARDLLGAPGRGPAPVRPVRLVQALPGRRRACRDRPVRTLQLPAEPCLHVLPQVAGWWRASPASVASLPSALSTARPTPGTPACRPGSRRCDAARGRSFRDHGRARGRSHGPQGPGPSAARDPRAPRNDRYRPVGSARSTAACRQRDETSATRQAKTRRPATAASSLLLPATISRQNSRSTCLAGIGRPGDRIAGRRPGPLAAVVVPSTPP